MRLKKAKKNKMYCVAARCTDEDSKRIQTKANIYTEGNISEYLIYSALNFVPDKDDLEIEESGGVLWEVL